ncbi:hypothetical protein HH1059_06610 [Halorhodospira halochloris]|uniref:Uncharacterized protein n=1 Tax=Halorhodospira halochloris TaxID=1052 RepID=A0A0X8X9D3_HALHR|nr:hypothetical protein [Halorhodospira halochloris]MBK1652869.1 hypothetical protein [Halorhodospira halochloris]BAU57348.1 hypothetical protein HH1059_06610 [Halorhodospira halochloris]
MFIRADSESKSWDNPLSGRQSGGVLLVALAGLVVASVAAVGVAHIASSTSLVSSTDSHSDRALYATESARLLIKSDISESELDRLDERHNRAENNVDIEGIKVGYRDEQGTWGFGREKDPREGYSEVWVGWSGGARPSEAAAVHKIGRPISEAGKLENLRQDSKCETKNDKIGPSQRGDIDDCWLDPDDELTLQGAPASNVGGKICVVGDVSIKGAGAITPADFFVDGSVITGDLHVSGRYGAEDFTIISNIEGNYWENSEWLDCVEAMMENGDSQSQWQYVRR